jgi:predicted 3-demethylubiquinone-9 3-methyltransferase (glyoxalase superfamily)
MQKIQTFLWFNDQAEEAANFYTSIFKNSKLLSTMPGSGGKPMGVTVELEGREFILFNGGPMNAEWKFTGATSFFINCETQEEVDHYWQTLSDGGRTDRCGWLTDKFGITWQIVPTALGRLLGDKDRQKAGNVMNAMLQMNKLDIAGLEQAYNQG